MSAEWSHTVPEARRSARMLAASLVLLLSEQADPPDRVRNLLTDAAIQAAAVLDYLAEADALLNPKAVRGRELGPDPRT